VQVIPDCDQGGADGCRRGTISRIGRAGNNISRFRRAHSVEVAAEGTATSTERNRLIPVPHRAVWLPAHLPGDGASLSDSCLTHSGAEAGGTTNRVTAPHDPLGWRCLAAIRANTASRQGFTDFLSLAET